MAENRVQFQDVLSSQLPRYVQDDFPLLQEFLEQYYLSQEIQGGNIDLIQNLDQYVKVDQLFQLETESILGADLGFQDKTIVTSVDGNFTDSFPDTNGLLKIDNEIIFYKTKTDFNFEGCIRGFSGITSYISPNNPDQLVFEETRISKHSQGATIQNLNVIFLQEFFKKLKAQITPGFSDRKFDGGVNQRNFIFGSNSFYNSKGTDSAFKILFNALYGKNVEVIRPSKYLLRPSDANYRVTQDIILESITGNPLELLNRTLYQRSTGARGSVSNIIPLVYNEGQYFQASIDYGYQRDTNTTGSIYSKFETNPKTKILNNVSVGSSVIDVDSTVGFAKSGSLVLKNADDEDIITNYTSKNINQFFGVDIIENISEKTDVRQNNYSVGYVGFTTENEIRVRVAAALKTLKYDEDNRYYNKGDIVNIQSLGLESNTIPSNNWYFNVKTQWDVLNIIETDSAENKYLITTEDEINLYKGYRIVLTNLTENAKPTFSGTVTRVTGEKSFEVKLNSSINVDNIYSFENQILRGNSIKYDSLNNNIANIQNTYAKSDDVLIASNSIPFYDNIPIDPSNKSITFTGDSTGTDKTILVLTTNRDHGFWTGDAIFYNHGRTIQTITNVDGQVITTEIISQFTGVSEGVYYVNRLDSSRIQLSKSTSDLYAGEYVTLNGFVVDNKFTYYPFFKKQVEAQKILREVTTPNNESGTYDTDPGSVGILINGVEILSYKSKDEVFYGPLTKINIREGGNNYDVINPPALSIVDTVGTGATGEVSVSGDLKDILISDTGFDYVEKPIVKITGGDPTRVASASVQMSFIKHQVSFNAEESAGQVNLGEDTIGFGTFHKFRDNEEVFYKSFGNQVIAGLSSDSRYFVEVVDGTTIKLHTTFNNANVGINTINLSNYGSAVQAFESSNRKAIVTDVIVTDRGEGYKNKKRFINSDTGISTALNRVNIKDHGYENKQIVLYDGNDIIGLSTNEKYYVKKINDDEFELSLVGTGSTYKEYYYDNNVIVNILSEGTGSFNYEPIVATVEGVTGVSSAYSQDFNAKIIPLFRGSIDSIDLSTGGVGYGASTILNLNRRPVVSFKSGEGAILTPVVSNGVIVDIIINSGGNGYNSTPDLIISGSGTAAKITPIISNGRISDVKIINGGAGYNSENTTILVQEAGFAGAGIPDITRWRVNLFAKNFDIFTNDDTILETNIDGEELQVYSLYSPRALRQSSYSRFGDGNIRYGIPDLVQINGIEQDSTSHSPILGWAYDGNPIYGAYGYETTEVSTVKQLRSGYSISIQENRPPTNIWPAGFFTNDYKFTGEGDLDVHNGRFGKTPDYPDGVYAYFMPIEKGVDSSGPFQSFKRPQFPFVIGESFKSKPNQFNYASSSNQTDYDLVEERWYRNTLPYHTNDSFSSYPYIFNSDKVKPQTIEITATSIGGVKSVGITTGGNLYKVKDKIVFDNNATGGSSAQAKVSRIDGKIVNTVSVASTEFTLVEFKSNSNINQFIGFTSVPHGFLGNEIVVIDGLSNYFKGFPGSYTIGVRSDNFVTTLGIPTVSTTGIATYFYVSGELSFPFIRPNDILTIDQERVKVLNIDRSSERIRVLRAQDGTSGFAHTSRTALLEDPRKFSFSVPGINTTKTFNLNEEIYFNPADSVGVATVLGATGSGTTVFFNDPGVGKSFVFLQPQQLFLPNHGLNVNDELQYRTNGGSSIQIFAEGDSGYKNLTNFEVVYAAPFTKDIIGIATNKVGLGTTGVYTGVGTDVGLMFFAGIGTGTFHSFRTNLSDVIKSDVTQNTVTVSTASTHGLTIRDEVEIFVKPSAIKTVTVKYNEFNRRIVFDPVTFSAGDVDVVDNTILISDNNFKNGDKVIFTTTGTPPGGMENEKMYYVFNYTLNRIRLVEDRFELERENPLFVDFTTGQAGTLSLVNPLVDIERGRNLKFDLSDPSLSFEVQGNIYSAFEMQIFRDSEFLNRYVSSGLTRDFEVTTSGKVGIDADANLTIGITDNTPVNLWYDFKIINEEIIRENQAGIVIDTDVIPNNQINIVRSQYDGIFNVSGIGSTTFSYSIAKKPSVSSYNRTNSDPTYITSSLSALGPINRIEVGNDGYGYRSVPGVTTVTTVHGKDAILIPDSDNIGKILNYRFSGTNIGFDYPTDFTLRPVSNLPEILNMDSYKSFDFIGISSSGRNYLNAPDLIVQDSFTKELVDCDIRYQIGDSQVTIFENVSGIYENIPNIIPINNSNGIKIDSVVYNNTTKIVRLNLNSTFSNASEFRFDIGSKIIVENIDIGIGSTGRGYNSKDYNYELFTIIDSDGAFGGSGAFVEYSLKDILDDGNIPGNVSSLTLATVTSEGDFPIFDIVLKNNQFFEGETVSSDGNKGKVISWRDNVGTLKVSSDKEFSVGKFVVGETSNTRGIIRSRFNYNSEIEIGAGTTTISGWQRNTGFLNENTQRLPNNDYYQEFSYSLQSEIDESVWNDPVSALNHTSGYKKFSDHVIESSLVGAFSDQNIISVEESNIDIIVDVISTASVMCVYDFDEVSENSFIIDGVLSSNEINFKNKILTDFFQSVGNRVLTIDDFSGSFNDTSRSTDFSIVSSFESNMTYNKIITFVKDNTFVDEKQFSIVSLLQRNANAFSNDYSILDTVAPLGFYDFQPQTGGWNLIFEPNSTQFNNYLISTLSVSILNNNSNVDSRDYGSVVRLSGGHTTINSGSSGTLVSVADTYRAMKYLVQLNDSSDNYFVQEINAVHDGTDVYYVEYGDLDTSSLTSVGAAGTFGFNIGGGNVDLIFYSGYGSELTSNVSVTSIASTATGVSSERLSTARILSDYTSIPSSGSPVANVVNTFTTPFEAGYYIISVEDTTNNEYQISELSVLASNTGESFTVFGEVTTNGSLGTIGFTSTGDNKNITWTPNPSTNQEVRLWAIQMEPFEINTRDSVIPMENVTIRSGEGSYVGAALDLVQSFELTHKEDPIFKRSFSGNNSEIVDVVNNSISIPRHFFVTGEQVTYVSPGIGNTAAITIESTNVPGIGLTTKLPPTLFVVKVDDGNIKFSTTAQNALANEPIVLDISGVGIGLSHSITTQNQNARCLMAIDNVIQSPVTGTAITYTTTQSINLEQRFGISGITSIQSSDLVKINDEIMKITNIGVGGTNNISVQRGVLGTLVGVHPLGSLVTKVSGSYNIVDNTVNFIEAPKGLTPLSTTTGDPDDRDYTGISTHSTFQGRVFLRSGVSGGSSETYSNNYVFDNISDQFTGITSQFNITKDKQNITGFSSDNAFILINDVFQKPQGTNVSDPFVYDLTEQSGITSIRFLGEPSRYGYDPNRGDYPLGGMLLSIGSTGGFGYQPLVAAGGTAIVSGAGTITSIAIGNSGSGYRVGIQTVVNVGVQTYSNNIPNITIVGVASISNGNIVSVAVTNGGSGFSQTNTPDVIIDPPFSYFNVPLVYSSESPVGSGQSATVDIKVGQGSSVIDLKIRNKGFGYGDGEILTVDIGGTTGIPTDTSKTFSEFQITISKTFNDVMSGWNVGELEVLDDLSSKFDDINKAFKITLEGAPISIQAERGSNVEVDKTLLIFLNDILQQPEVAYKFTGGSQIEFAEAPRRGDTCSILFYKGSGEIDVVFTDVLETVKTGDKLTLNDNPTGIDFRYQQNERTVVGINTIDSVETNVYSGPGVTTSTTLNRPVTWCKQLVDKVINNNKISKDRVELEPEIQPSAYLINSIGSTSTTLYVNNVRPLFNQQNESNDRSFQDKIQIISQDEKRDAKATATVNDLGEISSINLTDSGAGYQHPAEISISRPGFGNTATATVSVINGEISNVITITDGGSGYTTTTSPIVIISPPQVERDVMNVSSYSGDYGIVVGFGTTTSSGVGSETQLILDFFIPPNSYLRDNNYVSTGITVSQINENDYFTVFNSNVGFGSGTVVGLKTDGTTRIGMTTENIDQVYQVVSAYNLEKEVTGIGVTTVRRIFTNVGGFSTITLGNNNITFDSTIFTFDSQVFRIYQGGIGTAYNFGKFSWGKIDISDRTTSDDNEFNFYGENGYSGINTSAVIQRFNPLKYNNYTS